MGCCENRSFTKEVVVWSSYFLHRKGWNYISDPKKVVLGMYLLCTDGMLWVHKCYIESCLEYVFVA